MVCGLLASCQNQAQPVVTPLPSPTPHTQPTAAILQSGDVSSGLSVCLGSGPIDVYLSVLQASDQTLATQKSSQWQAMVAGGATAGAISLFAASASACKAELGATPSVNAMMSFVAEFGDEGQADRAWQAGVFGFTPPAPGVLSPGLTVGTATGLGSSSFTYERPSVRLACWRHGIYVALVVVSNLDAKTFQAATATIDPRLN